MKKVRLYPKFFVTFKIDGGLRLILTHLLLMQPFSTPVFSCFLRVKKGCIGNKWFEYMHFKTHGLKEILKLIRPGYIKDEYLGFRLYT